MTKISEMPAVGRGFISNLDLPVVEEAAWTPPLPANKRRISIVSTAAVHRRDDKPFSWLAKDYRAFHKTDRDLVMSHVAVEFDRSAWQQDLNTIIPLDRLEEMAIDGEIGSVAEEHYSFMGAADPVTMEKSARQAAAQMKQDGVNTVFLIPI
ncbi:MAG: glycine/sarcosine/betaine reductase selenoprotein B family protein [Planktomarina sp.]|nr:glycine/sarcosine/betaine reductase selenoprotein B family protein [Planktomarina sp.]